MDKGRIISALCVMAGLVVIGLMLPRAASTYRSFERTVSVKGLCEKEMPADKVIWPLRFKVVGNDIQMVSAEMDGKLEIVRKFLLDGGIDPSEISVAAPQVSDKYASEYGSIERPFRYVLTCNLTVCTKEVDKALSLMGRQAELIKKDIAFIEDWDSHPQFDFEALNDIKPEMVEEATKNAREVALKFAKDSGSRLGKIKEASQGTFSISDRDSNTPNVKNIRIVTYVTYYLSR